MSVFSHASLNRSFSLVWNEKTQAWVPAPERSRARGKRGATVIAAALTVLLGTAQAGPQLPTGGQVTAGAATIQQSGSTLNIQQGTKNAAIDWQQFSIGAGGTVRFDQPSSASVALNRVIGQDPSQILGSLQANGQVFLVNPNGILFGQGAQVSTAGLLASTRDISSADFASGQFRFSGSSNGKVVNQGTLSAGQGGYVVLIGAQVVNAGTIQAPGGEVRLAAADAVSVRIDGAGLAGFTVERGTIDGLVANHGLIQANGGRVGLTADAADALAKAVVNHAGIIEAQAVASHNGVVELRADAQVGQVEVSGRIDVSSASGTGGTATATAHAVNLTGTSAIDASGATGGGKVLIGGGWQGQDASIANASVVTMAPGARIDVSARDNGNGGTAVLWSQDGTAFAGEIAARGGAQGGSGGKVETSSHDVLQVLGSVDASAAAGVGGQWLLDPRNVTIAASGASGTGYGGSTTYNGSSTFTPGADSVILASTIVNTLNAGSNVTITTGSSGTSAGDITVNAPIVTSGVYSLTNNLSLLAAGSININARIADTSSAYFNRLNVVLTPGAAGNVNFSSTGSITTAGGNVYIGSVSGSGYSEAVSRAGQNLTMAAGSFIDTAGGVIDAKLNGTITLAANTLRNSGGTPYYNSNGNLAQNEGSAIRLTGASIVSTNTDAATPDITARANVVLSADSIGSAVNPIKISGYDTTNSGYQLSVNNTVGSSYANEIARQAFRYVSLNIGSQAHSTQDIRLLGDFGGDGHSGTGHLLLKTDGSGVLNLAAGDIATGGLGSATATSVQISAGNITFADGSVNTGYGSFRASADTLTAEAASANNNVAEILAPDVQLVGRNIGTQSNPLELSSGATTGNGQLSIYNTGGSTFAKVVDDNFTSISLNHEKTAGTHAVLFSGGDHLDYYTDGSNILLPTLSGGASDGSSFFVTTGLDATRRNRSVSITANSGGMVFADNAVNLGYGDFSATIARQNTTGTIAAVNTYDANAQVAQITAGNVSFSVQNDPTPGVSTIGAGGKQIQIAQGAGASNNTLSVSTQQGSVAIQELTQNHFKNISLSLGSASAAQNVAIGLAGPDDIHFSDSGSLVSIDATKVNLASGDRSFSLTAGSRSIQIDGKSQGTGNYNVYAGNLLKLNSDIVTDGGNISLTGYNGIDLMRSVRIDSNADRLGNGGAVTLATSNTISATLSGTAAGQTLTVDTSSTDAQGGTVNAQMNVNNRAGAYLGGMTLKASGATYAQDGYIYLGNSDSNGSRIYLKGDFSSTGKTQLNGYYGFTLDTEQGNTAAGGNITFAGADLTGTGYFADTTFDTGTSLAGASGGNVTLATQNLSNNGLNMGGLVVNARGTGTGGTWGDISLGKIATTSLYGGSGGQSYYGRTITLNGDLSTTGISMMLGGEVRLARSVTIDTNATDVGSAGGVSFTGAISATVAGAGLVIDASSSVSGTGGGVGMVGAGNAGGYFLDSLSINATGSAGQANGSIGLGGTVATEGAQTYAGGTVNTRGGLSTNGGNIDLRNVAAVTLTGTAGSAYTITTDRAGGSNAAGALLLGGKSINGGYALTIDTTADGGGGAADLALNGVGATTVFNSIHIAAGNITLAGTARSSGAVTMEARGANADLTLTGTGAVLSGSGNNIVLAAGRNFLNNRGASGILPGSGGSYYVYSSNPTGTVEGITGYSKHYNQAYSAGSTPAYAGSGNWFFYTIAPVITVASNANSIVYGSADPSLVLGSGNYSGFIDGDSLSSFSGSQSLTLAGPGTLSGAGYRRVGSYGYTLNGTLTDNLGYQYAPFSQNLAVTPRDLAISGVAASNRDYDGTTGVTLTGNASAHALAGDAVTADGSAISGSFANANAGVGKTVNVTGITIGGADSSNYQVVQPANVTATIAPKVLSISGSTVVDKTYDGNTQATVAAGTLSGLVGYEILGVSGAGTYSDKNAGAGKSVNAIYTLANGGSGGLASNYTLAGETLTGNIAQRVVTLSTTANSKVYDGGLGTGGYSISITNLVGGDAVSFTGGITAAFADKNVGTNKTVHFGNLGLTGTDAGNYVLPSTTATATASITAKAISVVASGVGKVYDGALGATATLASSGVVRGDSVDFSGIATYADKNAGTGKTVGVSGIGASGADAGNYTLTSTTASTTADITAKAITVAASGLNKVYDGTTSASANLASSGVVSGDVVSFSGTATLNDKNVGRGKTVNVAGISASGSDAGNYTVNSTAGTTADVTAKAITVAATGVNKVYDGTTVASANLASSGVVSGDVVSFNGTAALNDKNVGVGKTVQVAGIGSSGTDAGNYVLNNSTASTTADVTAKAITVAASGVNKVYDGTTAASANLASSGVVSGDVVSFNGTATLNDKNAGTGKTVNVAGIGSSGTDAGNYVLNNSTASTTADVTAKAITVAASGVNKVYDGTTAASANLASSGVVSGDVVSFNGTATLNDKNAGTGKTVNVAGIGASGIDAGNYVLNNSTAGTTADVTAKAITVAASGVNKVYDGTTAASANLSSAGVVSGDVVSFNGTATLTDKNVGTGKSVNVAGIGASGTDAGNYVLNNSTASATADVTAKAITVAASGVNKVYDGTTAASANLSSAGVVSGDVVSFNGTATLTDKNVGTGKTVNVAGIGSSGTDAGNYVLNNSMASTTADVTAKAITVAASGVNKVYDGTTAASANLSSAGVVSGDVVSFNGTATLTDKNVGMGKAVNVAGIGASGTDAGNYVLNNSTAGTTADVTAKAITVAAGGVNKVYDGTTAASANLSSSGVVSGDMVSFNGTATLDDKNVGTGKAVNVAGIGSSGTDAGNYVLNNSTASTTADVTAKAITVAAGGVNKVYDGTTAASANLASSGVVSGDRVSFSGTATLNDKNVGTGKAVNVAGIGASGTDAGNYVLSNSTASTTADVTAKAITVAASGVNKVYDGTTSASATLESAGLVSGDVVSFNGTATLNDKNVGTGKTVNVAGIGASGIDAGNYVLNNSTASTTADVTAKAITVAASGVNKVYDGTTAASANLASAGVVSGDVVSFSGTATLNDKNVGTAKAVNVAGIGASGTDAGNYVLSNSTASATADVTAKAITVAATGVNKVYDGSTAVDVQLASNGVVAGDVVRFNGTGNLADKNAGLGKAVTVAGIGASGADAGNYQVNGTASTTADVAQRALSVTLDGAVTKTQDGNLLALLRPENYRLQGLVAGERISVTQTAGTYADMAVGKGKVVTTTLGAGDYRGEGQTLVSNYQTYSGELNASIGEIKDALSSSAAYMAAVNSATHIGAPGVTLGERIRVEAQDGAQAQGTERRREATVVSSNTRENLSFRRAFSIGDGGIRLPAGVIGSDKDASQ